MPSFFGPNSPAQAIPMFLADTTSGQYFAPSGPAVAIPVFTVDPDTGQPTSPSGDSGSGTPQPDVATASAAGTNQATATALTAAISIVTSVNAGTGVMLPNLLNQMLTVVNAGVNALNIFPLAGMTLAGYAQNAPLQVVANKAVSFVLTSATHGYVLFGSPSAFS